jgi:hypothetical protein
MKAIDWHNFFSLFGVTTMKVDLFGLLHLQSKDDSQKFALKAIPMPLRTSKFKWDEALMNCKSYISHDVFADVHPWFGTGNCSYLRTNQLEQESASVQAAFFLDLFSLW